MEPHGHFWVWGNKTLVVVDPVSARVVNRLALDAELWSDPVYADGYPVITERNEEGDSELYVFNTDPVSIHSRMLVGERPYHIYYVPFRREVWSHSDYEGQFDVLSLQDLTELHYPGVKAYNETPSHGKFLFDSEWGSMAFATTSLDPGIHEMDLENKDYVRFINMSDPIDESGVGCLGTHDLAVFKDANVLVVECTKPADERAIWEVDAETLEPLFRHAPMNGATYAVPDAGDLVFVGDRRENKTHILRKTSRDAETEVFSVTLPEPWKVAFYNTHPDPQNVSHWLAFVGLEREGIAVLDMTALIDGEESPYEILELGPGNQYRAVERGGPWIATTLADDEFNTFGLAIIDAETLEVREVEGIPEMAERVLWVPDEKGAHQEIQELKDRIEELEKMIEQLGVVGGGLRALRGRQGA
ncbi:unnamed protein product [Vitrella brassicaformis CCMP3155]|uniref:Uncharacterized protein n=1 Tax=Vitrella brassicaformis (strain CCMP3155) TaxID=1169540 RepID=A0A0G4FYD8_VITBC|nr:unnamed protein product [Vitrella brassicaformis CCMP3155]|eukprot:CEM20370.1 unnamed protein product [Vitrella brassicaformis CCMP3155]